MDEQGSEYVIYLEVFQYIIKRKKLALLILKEPVKENL